MCCVLINMCCVLSFIYICIYIYIYKYIYIYNDKTQDTTHIYQDTTHGVLIKLQVS